MGAGAGGGCAAAKDAASIAVVMPSASAKPPRHAARAGAAQIGSGMSEVSPAGEWRRLLRRPMLPPALDIAGILDRQNRLGCPFRNRARARGLTPRGARFSGPGSATEPIHRQ